MIGLDVRDVAELRRRAARGLAPLPPPGELDPGARPPRGDFDLDPENRAQVAPADLPRRAAAVLVPIIARPLGLTVLLTRRPDHLASHPGQIAFPGGKIESTDASPLAAALREAEEEIGLEPALVEPIGYLDRYQTGTGFLIVPVVGLVAPEFSLALDAAEVAEAFEVPLAFLLNPANHQRHEREWGGRRRRFHAMAYGERYIWGATAGMLRNLYERLR